MTEDIQKNNSVHLPGNIDGTQERIKRDKEEFLEKLMESSGIVTIACQKQGIARATFYNWFNSDPEFKKQVETIKKEQVSVVEDRLLKAILEGNIPAIIFYLKCRHPEFKPKSEISFDSESINKALDTIKSIIGEHD